MLGVERRSKLKSEQGGSFVRVGVPYRKKETQREGFVCAREEGSHCIIYNSGLMGKLIKPKNTVSVAYIHVGNTSPIFSPRDHKAKPTKVTQRQGSSKESRGTSP